MAKFKTIILSFFAFKVNGSKLTWFEITLVSQNYIWLIIENNHLGLSDMSEKFENVAGASAKTMNVFAIGSYMIGSLQLCHRSFPSWFRKDN